MFSLLPRRRTPWYEFAFSYGLLAIAIAILVWIPVLHPEILERPKPDYHAIELVPTPVPVNHEPQRQLPRPVLTAKLDPPTAALRLPAPQPRPKPVDEETRAPEVKIAEKKVDIPAVASPIPKQIVRTNLFSTGSSAPQTIDKPPQQVQTGGFGDPKGVPARTTQTRAINIASAGGFDMPTGPGNGNGTGGSNGARGVVASTGFGGGVATARSACLRAQHGSAGWIRRCRRPLLRMLILALQLWLRKLLPLKFFPSRFPFTLMKLAPSESRARYFSKWFLKHQERCRCFASFVVWGTVWMRLLYTQPSRSASSPH